MCEDCDCYYSVNWFKVITSILLVISLIGVLVLSIIVGVISGQERNYGTFYFREPQIIDTATGAPNRIPVILTTDESRGIMMDNSYIISFDSPGVYEINYGIVTATGVTNGDANVGISILEPGETLTTEVEPASIRTINNNFEWVTGQITITIEEGQRIYLSVISTSDTTISTSADGNVSAYVSIVEI